jgi:tetratricopeptide (TPR) repeat protein
MLIRDVAYATIAKAQRLPRHARHAEWLRQIAGDRLPEFADVIAHHWLQVVALRRELGQPDDPRARGEAIDKLMVAGDRARGAYANATALHHYGRALDLEPPPAGRLRALLGRGEVWMLMGQHERAREDFSGVLALARQIGEPRWEAVALDHLGVAFRRQDQIAEALDHLGRALAISRQADEPTLTARILNHIGFTHFNDGKHREAIAAHEEARRLLESVRAAQQDLRATAELAESRSP